jgi:hypothetical protein
MTQHESVVLCCLTSSYVNVFAMLGRVWKRFGNAVDKREGYES